MKLRYTGSHPTSFLSPPLGELEPGQEFSVSEEDAERLMYRSDMEVTEGPSEDTEEEPPADGPAPTPEVQETPTEVKDEGTPDKPARRRPAKPASSGSADTTK